MLNNENIFIDARERVAQEERRRIRDRNRKNDQLRKIAISCKIFVGEIVIKNFPEVTKLQPKLKQADTNIEFSGLDDFFSKVAQDPKFSAMFQELFKNKPEQSSEISAPTHYGEMR